MRRVPRLDRLHGYGGITFEPPLYQISKLAWKMLFDLFKKIVQS